MRRASELFNFLTLLVRHYRRDTIVGEKTFGLVSAVLPSIKKKENLRVWLREPSNSEAGSRLISISARNYSSYH
jgi:hypothetical protein